MKFSQILCVIHIEKSLYSQMNHGYNLILLIISTGVYMCPGYKIDRARTYAHEDFFGFDFCQVC